VADPAEWYRTTLLRLVRLGRVFSNKYPRARVWEFLPDGFASIIEELLHEQESVKDKHQYYQRMVETLIATDSAGTVIIALAELIQRLTIARLNVFPTVDPTKPYALTAHEKAVVERLKLSFVSSKRLQQHVRFLFSKGRKKTVLPTRPLMSVLSPPPTPF
jgi:fructose-1,6-bisphosphatase